MKKYVSLILCAVLLAGAIFVNYEPKLAGKGDGKNQTVQNYEEFSSVLASVTEIADFSDLFKGDSTASADGVTLLSTGKEAASQHNSVTISTDYRTSSDVTVADMDMSVSVSGNETWYITDGGDRFYIEVSADIGVYAAELDGSSNMSMDFCLYYEADLGFFIKYTKITMPGAYVASQMLNKWISVDSFSGLMDASAMFEQTLLNNYNWLSALDSYMNEYQDESFSQQSKSLLVMKDSLFREFSVNSMINNSEMLEIDTAISEDNIESLTGSLKIDLSDKDAPCIQNNLDVKFSFNIEGYEADYIAKSKQKITITNIDNTVVNDLSNDKIYDLEDVIGGM